MSRHTRKSYGWAIGLVAGALLWSGAAAANSCHQGAFNGFYVGATVGYAELDATQHPAGEPTLSNEDGGATVGGHAGYNLQCGGVVIGIEGDVSYVGSSTLGRQTDRTELRSEIDTFGSLRGRLGLVVHDDVMVYATAGVAFAERDHSVFAPAAPGGPFSQTNSDTATGWVIGGGVEFLRYERWLLRAEVLYADLGSESRTYTVIGCGVPCVSNVRWEDEIITARIGVSYKFGASEVPRHESYK